MIAPVRAGLAYFAAVFLVGTVLGVLRNLLLVPRIGATTAVALEVPLMLTAAWLICGAVLRRIAVPPRPGHRIVMGGTALALLWLAEALLAAVLGMAPRAYAASLATPAGLLGIAAQVAFAVFPLRRRRITAS